MKTADGGPLTPVGHGGPPSGGSDDQRLGLLLLIALIAMEPATWELKLLSRAQAGMAASHPQLRLNVDPVTLARAYAQCEVVTRTHSRTFFLASGLLPAAKRRAVRALYAFCRVSDDLVDQTGNEPGAPESDVVAGIQPAEALERWRSRALSDDPPADDLVALAWADTRARYGIPKIYAEQLLQGVAQDLQVTRYATFETLAGYAYAVASTVGLMSMHIVGFAGEAALPYAVKLGVALQLTNILRDVGEDWRRGRLYLPQDELAAHEISEDDIAAGRLDGRWREFFRFQIARNRRLYAEALPGIALLDPDGRFAIAAAAELYRAILSDIETHDYDVFHRRAHVGTWGKLRRLPGIWLSLIR